MSIPLRLGVLFLILSMIASTVLLRRTTSLRFIDQPVLAQSVNPLDDPQFFVRQHYRDFLNREPDASGLAFWTNEITSCGSNVQCVEVKRINVSAAFFLSIEFQETGYLVYRTRKAAYGNVDGTPVPVRRQDLMNDAQFISKNVIVGVGNWQATLDANKRDYFDLFVNRQRFVVRYPQTLTPDMYVDSLNSNSGGVLSSSERNALVADLNAGTKTRAQVLRAVAENVELSRRESNRAFVFMQYVGYLRRNPSDVPDLNFEGLQFWLSKLNQFGGNFIQAEMVKAFLASAEYNERFGPPKQTVYTNPTDPLLFKKRTATGEVINYYGTRDAVGMATGLTAFKIQALNGNVTTFRFDGAGRISDIEALGVMLHFSWQSGTRSAQVNVVITGDDTVDISVPVTFTPQGTLPFSTFEDTTFSTQTTSTSNVVTARVARCNGVETVDNAVVHVNVGGILGGDRLRMNSLGNGIYQAAIPVTASNPVSNIAALIDSIRTRISVVCDFTQTLGQVGAISPDAQSTLITSITAGLGQLFGGTSLGLATLRLNLAVLSVQGAVIAALAAATISFICDNPIGSVSEFIDRSNTVLGVSLLADATLDGISLVSNFSTGQPPGGPFNGVLDINFPQCIDHIDVTPTALSMGVSSVGLGNSVGRLTATAKDASNHSIWLPIGRFVWTSSNTNVATVDGTGAVTGKVEGTAEVTARDIVSNKMGSATTTVGAVNIPVAGTWFGTASRSPSCGGAQFSFPVKIVFTEQPSFIYDVFQPPRLIRPVSAAITITSPNGTGTLAFFGSRLLEGGNIPSVELCRSTPSLWDVAGRPAGCGTGLDEHLNFFAYSSNFMTGDNFCTRYVITR
jgi:hypothetical protein